MDIYKKYPQIFKNKRIVKKINELKLTDDQIIEGLPIFFDMVEEEKNKDLKWMSSFKINLQGDIVRTQERSKLTQKKYFLENIITHKFEEFIFNEDEELTKESGRNMFMKEIRDILLDLKNNKKGIYLHGAYGVGKTYLMKRVAKKAASEGLKVAFISTPNLVQELKRSFSSSQTGIYSLNRITDLIKSADYLFLDDIGSENISAWFRDDCLFPVLDYRLQHEIPTFFTSNFSMQKLEVKESTTTQNRFKEIDKAKRLISRIKALAKEVEITGTNKR